MNLKIEKGKLPKKLSIFAADHVVFSYPLNFKSCENLCFLIVGKAEFVFGDMKELAHIRIGDDEPMTGDRLIEYLAQAAAPADE